MMFKTYESFWSQKDIEKLTKDIISKIVSKTINEDDGSFHYVKFEDFLKNDYGILNDFLKDFKEIKVVITAYKDLPPLLKYQISSGVSGLYISNLKFIIIILNETQELIKIIENNPRSKSHIYEVIYKIIMDDSSDVLMHELQHAYDDWRSKGKYSLGKALFNKKGRKKDYINSRHEVDARFTEAIYGLEFYFLDDDKSYDAKRDIYSMVPYNKLLKKFKTEILYDQLEDDEKQRVLRKFGQFYEKEKAIVELKNKKKK